MLRALTFRSSNHAVYTLAIEKHMLARGLCQPGACRINKYLLRNNYQTPKQQTTLHSTRSNRGQIQGTLLASDWGDRSESISSQQVLQKNPVANCDVLEHGRSKNGGMFFPGKKRRKTKWAFVRHIPQNNAARDDKISRRPPGLVSWFLYEQIGLINHPYSADFVTTKLLRF